MPTLIDRVSVLGDARQALMQHRLLSLTGDSRAQTTDRIETQLVAYIVPRDGTAPSTSDLRAFLRTQVPAYMVPTAFVVLDRLPRTGGGKVDRQALPSPSATRPMLAAPCVQPRSDLERQIAGIWRDLLRLEHVGVDDNFFDLGGHSLLIVRMQMRVREVLHSDVGIVDLFRCPTVASLAAFLEDRDELQPDILTDASERAGRQRAVLERRRSTDAGLHRS